MRQRCDEFKILKPGDLAGMKIPNRGLQVINESDVYNLVFGSRLESAQRFRKWVTHDVPPLSWLMVSGSPKWKPTL